MTRPDRRPPSRRNAATWFRDGDGRPAAVAVQHKFLDFEAAFRLRCASGFPARIEFLHLPDELGWLSCPAEPRAPPLGFWLLIAPPHWTNGELRPGVSSSRHQGASSLCASLCSV